VSSATGPAAQQARLFEQTVESKKGIIMYVHGFICMCVDSTRPAGTTVALVGSSGSSGKSPVASFRLIVLSVLLCEPCF
jgi:hypothetical protein